MFYLTYNINKNLIMNKTVLIILLFERKKNYFICTRIIKNKSILY